MSAKEKLKKGVKKSSDDLSMQERFLILHNDDEHSFDYVIKALIDVCSHDYMQATQCTMITHYKGKCDIKKGIHGDLKPMKDALTERELKATID